MIFENIIFLLSVGWKGKTKLYTARPPDTRPRGVRTLEIHGFELDHKTLEIHGFWPKALKMLGFIWVS